MSFHPFAVEIARQHVRNGLRAKGVGLVQRFSLAGEITAADLDGIAASVGATVPPEITVPTAVGAEAGAVGALGDGHILAAIEAFFASPTGQMILGVLLKAILAAIGL